MSAERFTLDTHLLVYAMDRDAGERHQKAIAPIDRAVEQHCVLTVQVPSDRAGVCPIPGVMRGWSP